MAMTYFADRQVAQEVVDSQDDSNIIVFSPIMYSMINDLAPNFADIVEQAALSTDLYDGDDAGEWGEE